MPIRVACPMCGRTGRVPDDAVGRSIQCPACGHRRRLTVAAIIPEGIDVPARSAPAGIDEIEILEDESAVPSRPTAPAPPRPRPHQHPPQAVQTELPPPAENQSLNSVYSALAIGTGLVVVAIAIFSIYHAHANRGDGAVTPDVASSALAQPSASPTPASVVTEPELTIAATPSPRNSVVLSTADLVARCEPSVALIKGKSGSGTGFLVAPGVLATNSHVIGDEFISGLEVRFPSADEARRGPITAELVYEDEKRDLAFLAVRTDLPPLQVAQSYRYRKGEDVTVIGNPGVDGDMVLENAISRGVMSTRAELEGLKFYQLGIAVNPGNSGGPVFDQSGQVIGVVTLRIPGKEELSFCIPVEELREAMGRLSGQSRQAASVASGRHRMLASFKNLSGAGALYGVALELHVALKSSPGNNDLAEAAKKLDKALQEFKKSVLGPLESEAGGARNDASVPSPTRRQVGDLVDSYKRLREAFEQNRASTPVATIRSLKSNHRRQVVALGSALNVEVPQALLELLDDHLTTTGPAFSVNVPLPPGNGPIAPGDALRPRIWEGRRRMLPRSIPRPPGPPPGFGPSRGFPGRPGSTSPPSLGRPGPTSPPFSGRPGPSPPPF